MPDRKPLTRRAALGLIGTGAIASVASTFSGSAIDADRTTVLATASDPADAYVGLVDLNALVDDQNQPTEIARIDNNLNEELRLTVDVTLGTGLVMDSGFSTPVPAGGSTTLSVTCDSGSGNGTSTVDILVSSASGTSVSVENAARSLSVDRDCPGPSNPSLAFEADDPDGQTSTQRFRFSVDALKNRDTGTIDLYDAQQNSGVDYGSASPSIVSGHAGNLSLDTSTYELTYTASGNPKGTIEFEVSNLQFTSGQDGTATYSDSTGRQGSDSFSVPYVVSGNESGDISTSGDVEVQDDGTTHGDVDAGGDVTYGDNATASGEIDAGGDVVIGDGTTTQQAVTADGSVSYGSNATANGPIDAEGTVDVGQGTTIQQTIDAGDDVTLADDVTVNDDVTVEGVLYLGCNVTVNGDVDADQVVDDC